MLYYWKRCASVGDAASTADSFCVRSAPKKVVSRGKLPSSWSANLRRKSWCVCPMHLTRRRADPCFLQILKGLQKE